MTEELQDLNTFAQTFGTMADSFLKLHDMKVQVESDKYAYDIAREDERFLTDMVRPYGDPDRIDASNFRDRLESYNADVDARISQIKEPSIRAAVARQFQESRSQFNLQVSEKYFAQESANIQATSKQMLSDWVNKDTGGMDNTQIQALYDHAKGMTAEWRRVGMFDEASIIAAEQGVDAVYRGKMIVNDELAASSNDFDKASIAIVNGNYSEPERKAAIDELTRQGQNADSAAKSALASIFGAGMQDHTADYGKMLEWSKGLVVTAKGRDDIQNAITAYGIGQSTVDVTSQVTAAITDPKASYYSLLAKADTLNSWYESNDGRSAVKGDPGFTATFQAQMEKLIRAADDLKVKESASKESAKDAAYSKYTLMVEMFHNGTSTKDPYTGEMRKLTPSDLAAQALILNAIYPEKGAQALKELRDYGFYSQTDGDYYRQILDGNIQDLVSPILGGAAEVLATPAYKKSGHEDTSGANWMRGWDKLTSAQKQQAAAALSGVVEATKLWLAASPKRSPDEVREYMIKAAIPLLEAWSASTKPNKLSSVVAYGELADSGALAPLFASDPMKQDGGVSVLFGGYGLTAEEYRNRSQQMFKEAIGQDFGELSTMMGGGTVSTTPNVEALKRRGDMQWDAIGQDGKPNGYSLSVDNVDGKLVLRVHYPNGTTSAPIRTMR